MAEVAASLNGTARYRPVPASAQIVAVAWLRWRLFVNGFLRQQTIQARGVAFVLIVLLRIVLWSVFGSVFVGFAIGPVVFSGYLAWKAISGGHQRDLLFLLAGIPVAWQFFSVGGITMGASVPNFNPSSLARFPLPFWRYLLLRTFMGLLTFTTIVGCLMLLAAAIGIGIADHALLLPALIVLFVYAWMNIFFTRMLSVWFERWLASRRFRNIFGLLTTLFFVGLQFVSFNVRRLNSSHSNLTWLSNFPEAATPYLRWLPPGMALQAILVPGHALAALAQFLVLLAWTALFLGLYAVRLHKQFLGELLTEAPPRRSATSTSPLKLVPKPISKTGEASKPIGSPLSTSVIAACVRKELLDLGGSGTQLIAMLTPLFFVFVLSSGLFAQHPTFFLPGAVAYVLLGLVGRFYNIFGADGTGMQIYLLAPIRLRDVIVAKNLVSLMPVVAEAGLTWGLVMLLARSPIPHSVQISTALWLIFAVAINLTVGTLRSLQEPRKFDPKAVRRGRTPTSRSSGFLVLAIMLGSFLLYIPVTLLCRHLGRPSVALLIFAALATVSVASYAVLLHNANQLFFAYRDRLAEELCRV